MIEVTNRKKSPVQIILKSRRPVGGSSKAFTTKNIPGKGAGHNVYCFEDERKTEYIDRLEKMGLISVKHLPDDDK